MEYLENIKVGDKVCDVVLGKGEVIAIKEHLKLIKVKFDNGAEKVYDFFGRKSPKHQKSLFVKKNKK